MMWSIKRELRANGWAESDEIWTDERAQRVLLARKTSMSNGRGKGEKIASLQHKTQLS